MLFRQVFGQSFETNSITIGRNGSTINGVGSDVTITTPDAQFSFFYDGATWVMIFGSYTGVLPDAPPRLAGVPIAGAALNYDGSDPYVVNSTTASWGITSIAESPLNPAVGRFTLDHTASSELNLVASASFNGVGLDGITLASLPINVNTIDVWVQSSAGDALVTAAIPLNFAIWDLGR